MIEQEEFTVYKDQLVEGIEEIEKTIDKNIEEIKQMISTQEITLHQYRVLFHAMDVMLKERLELAEAKELALFDGL